MDQDSHAHPDTSNRLIITAPPQVTHLNRHRRNGKPPTAVTLARIVLFSDEEVAIAERTHPALVRQS